MNKQTLLAIVLCFAFLLVWPWFARYMGWVRVIEKESPQEEVAPPPGFSDEQEPRSDPPSAEIAEPAPVEESTEEEAAPIEREMVRLENDALILELDNQGGVVVSARLKTFFASNEKVEPIQLVSSNRHFPAEIILSERGSTLKQMFEVGRPSVNSVLFTYRGADFSIVKKFTLAEDYLLHCEVDISGANGKAPFYMVVGEGLQPVKPGERLKPSLMDLGAINPKIMHVTWSQNGDAETKRPDKADRLQFQPLLKSNAWLEWAGVKDNYFANVFMTEDSNHTAHFKATDIYVSGKPLPLPVVAYQAEGRLAGSFFMGPVMKDILAGSDPKLENLLSYGWAGFLSKYLFWGLEKCHDLTGNWGWAIILLTFFIRVLLIPLTIPGAKSSYKMKKLQPKLEKLKKKYSGSDLEAKQKLSQETFKIYKEEGVNPFSSCLTALAQMPVFFAYFSLLRSSIHLRQADWMFWIEDLSIKDPTYVLPIIMGVTMFLSTLAMPMPGGDPMQQKMMKFMPVIFSIMFIGMPAGLILYMITSNIFALGQTNFLKWRYEKA